MVDRILLLWSLTDMRFGRFFDLLGPVHTAIWSLSRGDIFDSSVSTFCLLLAPALPDIGPFQCSSSALPDMKKLRAAGTRTEAATTKPLALDSILSVVLLQSAYLQREEKSLQSLLLVSKFTRTVVLSWLKHDFVNDISRGQEAVPVPLSDPLGEAGSRLHVQWLLELLRFQYAVRAKYPLPFRQHALPPEVATAASQQHAAVQLVQSGRTMRTFLARDERKGWCVHAAEDIPCGAYLGEYTGEVISSHRMQLRFEKNKRQNEMNYVLVLREFVSSPSEDDGSDSGCSFHALRTIVDATEYGNFTRFMNHSCEPNLELTSVRVDSYIPRLVLFTRRDVKHGEELTFDYGSSVGASEAEAACQHSQESSSSRSLCHCGASRCRRFLPFDTSV